MLALNFVLLLCSLLFFVAAFDNPFGKCSINDHQCMEKAWEKVFRTLGSTGIPEINADPIDPMILKNITEPLIDGMSLTIKQGTMKGFKNCKFNNIRLNLEKKLDTKDVFCESLKISGEFFLEGTNPMFKGIFGTESISGHGEIKAKFEQVTMKLKLPTTVIKKEDGDTYLIIYDKPQYTFDLEKPEFNIKRFVFGKNDMSEAISAFLNNNWKTLIQRFGRPVIDKSLEFLIVFANNIYDNVPAKNFLEEDLTSYIVN
ncbi:unnamed protein product [Euphydryas editha]|uniref:Uncharacterized protein n=1 Tax=Euphydryas editha TaxID=104508 RepID=A0AAU9TCS0_EUPED|nr:unnamed protein product [Euphydryas editha]